MKNIKTIFSYVVVAALITALFISCKNKDKTGSGDDIVKGHTHTNHPPEGKYMWVHFSGTTNTSTIATVTHINGNCNITGKVFPISGNDGLDYDITVTSWYTHPDLPNYNRAGNTDGQATITKPASSTLEYFSVDYYTTNQSISVSLRTTPASGDIYYSALDLKKRD